jgi:hypothetical protein
MRTLLERIVEKTRNPELGAESALMPLATPVYAGAPTIYQPYLPVEERNFERDVPDTASVTEAVTVERPASIQAVAQPIGTQQATPNQNDESATQLMVPRRLHAVEEQARPLDRAMARDAEPTPQSGVFRPAEARAHAETPLPEVPALPPVAKQFHATPRSEVPVKAESFPEAKTMPARPPAEKPVPPRARTAAYQAANIPANTPKNDGDARVLLPQQVTVSIGHIEVRAAQSPPVERPRRPGFRPSLSLSDFLKQSDGGRR